MNSETSTHGGGIEMVSVKFCAPGVVQAPESRLTFWRQHPAVDRLESEEIGKLIAEARDMSVRLTPNDVEEEAYMLVAEAGFNIKEAVAADDWMAEESVSRDRDYRAIVCMARARMLYELADRLRRDGEASGSAR